jgi:hypothetical protein
VGWGFNQHYATKLPYSGRAYKLDGEKDSAYAQVEIGREGDIDSSGIAGSKYYSSAKHVRDRQKLLLSLAGKITPAFAVSDHRNGHIYHLNTGKFPLGEELCCLSESLNKSLFKVGNEIQSAIGGRNRRPPNELKYLRTYGIRTLVLPPDAPECEQLLEPWSESGIMLAPVILGYPKAFFRYY